MTTRKPRTTPRTAPKKRAPHKGQDRERVHQEDLEKGTSLWASMRMEFPESVRLLVDQLAAQTIVVSLADLKLLAVASERLLALRAEESWIENKGARTYGQYASVQLQYQKHLRHICALEGPGLALGDQPVRVPIGMTRADFESLQREIDANPDEIMS